MLKDPWNLRSPKNLMEELVLVALCRGDGRHSKPGALIEGLPEEGRAVLRKLRSEDVAKGWLPFLGSCEKL